MEDHFDSRFPSVEALRERARRRMPGFAFDYLDNGCFSNVNLDRNTSDIREIQLKPYYLRDYPGASQKTELFGKTWDAPFGIAPVGLQGLMWPKCCEFLAQAAFDHNVPFVLSTVGTASIETISEITEGKFWFQLYHPAEDELRDKLLERVRGTGYTRRHPNFRLSPQGNSQRSFHPTKNECAQSLPDDDPSDLVIQPTRRRSPRVQNHEAIHSRRAQHETPRTLHE